MLVARASAGPLDSEDNDDDDRSVQLDGGEPGVDRPAGARPWYVPVSNAAIQRIVTLAPSVARVVAAAYGAAGIADDPAPGWRRRSRWSALVPLVSVRAGQNQAWREVDDPTISHGVGIDIRAAWHLERLVFDPNEPRLAMLDVARRRERRRVAAHAIHLYFDWVTARAAADDNPRAELDAQELQAELDAVTAGWFSEALAKGAELR